MADAHSRGAFAREAPPVTTTSRLELRPLLAAAALALFDNREGAARLIGSPLSPAWPQRDLFDILPLQRGGPYGIWVIVERDSGEVIGDVGLLGPPVHGTVEIGYSVVPDRRGHGYAAEAARALVAWALSEPGVNAVVARCEPANAASIRTLEHAGFERISETADEIRWRVNC